jgi:hypothetical protein
MVESSSIHFKFCDNTEFLAAQHNDLDVWFHIQKLHRQLGEKFYLSLAYHCQLFIQYHKSPWPVC